MRQEGFSLVEVILALGLLGAVLVSIFGLFALGNRQVASGRAQTIALAAARDIVEDIDSWGYHQTYRNFGTDGGTSSFLVDSRSNSFASKWQDSLDRDLHRTHAEILLQSVAESGGTPPLKDSVAIRIVVTVFFSEGPRSRTVRLMTVRT